MQDPKFTKQVQDIANKEVEEYIKFRDRRDSGDLKRYTERPEQKKRQKQARKKNRRR